MMLKNLVIIVSFFQINLNLAQDAEDLYSSVTALNLIFNSEKVLIENLANYILKSEENTIYLKSFLNKWKENQQKTHLNNDTTNMSDGSLISTEVQAPVASFSIKHRFLLHTSLLREYFNETTKEIAENYKQQFTDTNFILPTDADLKGVTLGLLRVQQIYDIPAKQIANGLLNGIQIDTKFSASDCFEVGFELAKEDCHHYAIEWYKMALTRFDEEGWRGIQPAIEKNLIVAYLIHSLYKEDGIENLEDGIEIAAKALEENCCGQNELYLAENLKIFVERVMALKSGTLNVTVKNLPKGAIFSRTPQEMNLIKRACAGELRKSPAEERMLFCKYEKKNHPFLKLAPIKVEILNFAPYLVLFHDVLYDSEIETLKELSTKNLVRARVWNAQEGKADVSKVRTGKYFWINSKTHPLIDVINQRLSDMTGLTMETAEDFQMMNYGIGGHYDLHSDDLVEPTAENNLTPYALYEMGNRISTILFYLSDVLIGGGTIWPHINVIAYPKKGTAAFWYNLRHDGQSDTRAQHAACPVVVGSKWVMNKWVRAGGQMFRKPCYATQY